MPGGVPGGEPGGAPGSVPGGEPGGTPAGPPVDGGGGGGGSNGGAGELGELRIQVPDTRLKTYVARRSQPSTPAVSLSNLVTRSFASGHCMSNDARARRGSR